MKSKIELRQFAVSSALNLDDVTSETIISTAKAIEEYVLGSAEIPEQYDEASQVEKMTEMLTKNAFTGYKPTTDEKVIEAKAEREQTKVYAIQ